MSTREAEALVSHREGRLCVRFYRRKDGTMLTQNCPVGWKIVVQRASRVAGIAFSAVMATIPLSAQIQPAKQGAVMEVAQVEIPVVEVPPLLFEPIPLLPPRVTHRGFFRRAFDKIFHPSR
ncbi:MAG TPA: hypothetical protein VN872_01925 [Candidatus Acidoferrum sp.]|nr:hypothetical protein [Candidatus Acidoferrum sp.]